MTVINVKDLKYYEIEYFNEVEQRLEIYNNTIILPRVLKVKVQYNNGQCL